MKPADGFVIGAEALKIIAGESELFNRAELPITESHDFDTKVRAENRYRVLGWKPAYLNGDGKRDLIFGHHLAVVANHLTIVTSEGVPVEATSGDPEWHAVPAFVDERGSVTFIWRGGGCVEDMVSTKVLGRFTVKRFGISVAGFPSTERHLIVPPTDSLRWLQGREPRRPENLLPLPTAILTALKEQTS